MDKKEIEEFIIDQRIREGVSSWVRVRCMAAGTAIMTAAWALGSWAVVHIKPLTAAIKAFFATENV